MFNWYYVTPKILIIGASGQGRETAFYLMRMKKKNYNLEILGFIDDNPNLHNSIINNLPVLGGVEWLFNNNLDEIQVVIAIGSPKVKKKIVETIDELKLRFFNVIDPSSTIDSITTKLGRGLIIGPGSRVLTNTSIGDHVLINYNSVIGHDCKIHDFVNINPKVGIAGNVVVKDGASIGIGSNIIENTQIGEWSVVGAGAVVIKDVPDNVLVVGTPSYVKKHYSKIS